MPIDVTRYAFLINEYRYNYARDATITARYKKARRMEILTNLDDSAAAQTLCDAMYAVVGAARRRFEVMTAGTEDSTIDELAGGARAATLNAPELETVGLPVIVTRIIIDEDEDQVISEVWG